jgi:hypothetical protein
MCGEVSTDVEGTKVSIYKEHTLAKHPLLGLRFKNTTGGKAGCRGRRDRQADGQDQGIAGIRNPAAQRIGELPGQPKRRVRGLGARAEPHARINRKAGMQFVGAL